MSRNGSHSQSPCFEIRHLEVTAGLDRLVKNVALEIFPGSIHCLVGDSGSGKTMTSLASIGLLPAGVSARGEIRLNDVDSPSSADDSKLVQLVVLQPADWTARGGALHPHWSNGQ